MMVIPVREEERSMDSQSCGGMVPYDLGLLGCHQIAPSAVGGRENASVTSRGSNSNSFVRSLRYYDESSFVTKSFFLLARLSVSQSRLFYPKVGAFRCFSLYPPREREAMRVARFIDDI